MPILEPCAVCNAATLWRCSDCGVDFAGERITAICARETCREEHEGAHRFPRNMPGDLELEP